MNDQDNQQPSPKETHRVCRKCGLQKPIQAFKLHYNGKYRRRSCQECDRPEFRERHREWRHSLPQDEWRAKTAAAARHWRANMTPEQKKAFDEKTARKANERRLRVKTAVFMFYGGAICNCCGETEPKFLSIDHVNNDGYVRRKEKVYKGQESFYKWLLKNDCPPDYQVLCMNCNFGKARNAGVCPHQDGKVQRLERKLVAPSGAKPPALFCEEVKI